MSINWTTQRGKRILHVDYRGMTPELMMDQLLKESNLIMKEAEPVNYLGIFEDTVVNSEFMNLANKLGKSTEPKTRKSAVVGVKGMKAVLLNTYSAITGSKMKAFKTEHDALNYLTN